MFNRRSSKFVTRGVAATAVLMLAACANGAGDPVSGGSSGPTAQEKPFFEGKSIEILVPFSTGGGTDTTARFVANLLPPAIEGHPSVQVMNVPGGGSVLGMNEYVLSRESTGTNLVMSSGSTHIPYVLGQSAVEYELSELIPLMATRVGNIMYASSSSGIETAEDLFDADELIYAGISAIGADLAHLLAFEVLGLDVKSVLGYDGSGAVRVAFEQGESNLNYDTTPGYLTGGGKELVESGKAHLLYSLGQLEDGEIVRDALFPDLLTVPELYELKYGEWPSGEAYDAYKAIVGLSVSFAKVIWTHGDVPENALTALQDGIAAMEGASDFYELGADAIGEYELIHGSALAAHVENAIAIDPATVDWLSEWLTTEYDVAID